jgi:sec-independent protein translocase protein TatA
MFEGLFQPMHLLIILAIALVVFGPKRLPELGAGLGKSLREFKKAMSDVNNEINVTPEAKAAQKETPKEIASPTTTEVKQEAATKEQVEAKKDTTA